MRSREIIEALNREGVPPPRGRYWQPGALTGSNNRHSGILGNELYCGRRVWNKVRMIKNPETGRRVSRPNPECEWHRHNVPDFLRLSASKILMKLPAFAVREEFLPPFLGIEIRAVHEGVVNTVLVGLRGLVGQLYREDNAHKVRRGLAGRVGQGLNAGGRAYGYAPVAGEKGKRTIVEAEAEIVRRIFDEYVAGRTPREIAHDLNNESILPPRGRSWNASTINGNMQRGTGIIQNELYAGRLVWNKVRMVKDPDTGKRLSRPNPKNDWQTVDVPDLRIISQELFDAAQSRKQACGQTHPNQQRRPRHMLSGLLRCGACGAGMSTNGKDNSGRIRIRCSAATESGSCQDAKTFYLKTVESAVLAGLENEMRQPQVIAEYVRTYHEERKRLSAKMLNGLISSCGSAS